jgi:hypothetical protein
MVMTEFEQNKVRLLHRADGELQPDVRPIVLDYKKRKKKKAAESDGRKPKYSRGLKDAQRLEGDAVHVAQRASKAMTKGIETYERERQQSARSKRDGAIEDFINNSAKAGSAYMKEASDIPVDIAESLNRTASAKSLRKGLRRASRMIGIWRM